ncbi:Pre-mRNA-splicing regulator WTAP [Heterocephalus glaber]|uniref:Pre-mRNA-splicing regulator WTAP n=1 Tax=Heterocephalus glaber TaxID=10181 RepID=G5ALW7_HETGA|nr:Pre-mRNA-splicing regulator WTAP [Heterocephalus glaber]
MQGKHPCNATHNQGTGDAECTTQIQYRKQVQQPSVAQLRSTMVDPEINLFFLKMKGELEQTEDKLEQAPKELSAWKFMPESQRGKEFTAQCRGLIPENQELERRPSWGRTAQLEAGLALQKKYSEELKSSQGELNDFIIQPDEAVEGMQSTILVLQQQLKETRQQLAPYQQQRSQALAPSKSRTTSSEPVEHMEATSRHPVPRMLPVLVVQHSWSPLPHCRPLGRGATSCRGSPPLTPAEGNGCQT